MAAGKYDFSIEQGSSFRIDFIYKDSNKNPVDLTNWCAQLIWKTERYESKVVTSVNSSDTIQVSDPSLLVKDGFITGHNIPVNTSIVEFSGSVAKLSNNVTLSAGSTIYFEPVTYKYKSSNTDYTDYTFSVGANGRISLILPANTTNTFGFSKAKYDLDLESPNDWSAGGDKHIARILYGNISIAKRYSASNTQGVCS